MYLWRIEAQAPLESVRVDRNLSRGAVSMRDIDSLVSFSSELQVGELAVGRSHLLGKLIACLNAKNIQKPTPQASYQKIKPCETQFVG